MPRYPVPQHFSLILGLSHPQQVQYNDTDENQKLPDDDRERMALDAIVKLRSLCIERRLRDATGQKEVGLLMLRCDQYISRQVVLLSKRVLAICPNRSTTPNTGLRRLGVTRGRDAR
jgi:hypothetical protein